MKIFSADAPDFADFFRKLRSRGAAFEPDLLATVAAIIRDVTLRGDDAVFEYTKKFDGHLLSADTVEASGEERRNAAAAVDATDRDILQLAASRIEAYHRHQIAGDWSMTDPEGARLGQRVLPLSRIGIYAPEIGRASCRERV